VAAPLAERYTVVVCDLKGTGGSRASDGGPLGEGYSAREIGSELRELMQRLGFPSFAVVGHDRGARVGYRMALDHPAAVKCLAVLNIVPTADQFDRLTAETAFDYYPFLLLAQPPPLPQRLLGASAEFFVRHIMRTWTATPDAITPDAVDRYVAAFTPETINAWCAEYRAAFHLDRPVDARDRSAGHRIGCPVLVHWGARETAMSDGPLVVWRRWAENVTGGPLASGHFLPEEAPEPLTSSLLEFLPGRGA
jgi:haloacetate dehalogenase